LHPTLGLAKGFFLGKLPISKEKAEAET